MSVEVSLGSPAIRFLADQNFRQAIVEGLLRLRPEMDLQLVKDVGLIHHSDPEILASCKEQGRLLLTHDKRTMPRHLDDFLRALPAGEHRFPYAPSANSSARRSRKPRANSTKR